MAITISYAIQKGGVGKTTSAGITAYLLSQKGYKVLAIDLDSQGNLTQFLSGVEDPCDDFYEKTYLEAILEEDAAKYIVNVGKNMDLLPSNDFTAPMPRLVVKKFGKESPLALKNSLESIKDSYDYIIIDCPPALSDQTINALAASDYVVIMFETSKFCYNAMPRFIELTKEVRERFNSNLKVAGILRTLSDARRSDNKAFIELVQEDYPDLCFDTVINRRASTGRLPVLRFKENAELKHAVEQYEVFIKELFKRVND